MLKPIYNISNWLGSGIILGNGFHSINFKNTDILHFNFSIGVTVLSSAENNFKFISTQYSNCIILSVLLL